MTTNIKFRKKCVYKKVWKISKFLFPSSIPKEKISLKYWALVSETASPFSRYTEVPITLRDVLISVGVDSLKWSGKQMPPIFTALCQP